MGTIWRPGDEPGRRRFATLFAEEPLSLEAGGRLGAVEVAYETWGHPDPTRSNAVLVLHALTGDSHAAGPIQPGHAQAGWWNGVIGPGLAIDTDRWWVVCPNVLGGCQGTTGPSSPAPDGRPYGSRFAHITIRDQVAVEAALADHLEIERWAGVIGASMGGMRVLEWAVTHPHRVRSAVVVATTAAASAEQIALCSLQIRAVRLDPAFAGGDYYQSGAGPGEGLGLARRLGHVSYRSEPELAQRFARLPQGDEKPFVGGRYSVESYLDHQASKLVGRFDPNSYIVLSEAMNHHDIGRGRGGVAAALRRVTAEVTVVGIDSDRLYPLYQQAEIAAQLPGRPDLAVVSSPYGHDGFLIESEQVGKSVAATLAAL
jgi:homoserine O-acetyltransferase